MKKFKRFSIFSVLLLIVILLVACGPSGDNGNGNGDPVEIKISLNQTSVTLDVGQTFKFEATVEGSTEAVTWASSTPSVATVDEGLVKGLSAGKTTITASAGEKSATATVTVTDLPFPIITPSQNSVELVMGSNPIDVTAEVKLDGVVVEATLSWESLDVEIATVSNGTITPVGFGTTKIRVFATYNDILVEAFVDVKVNVDASLLLSSYEVELDTIDFDGTQVIEQQIDISTFVNGVETTDEVIKVETTDTNKEVVDYVLDDYVITITSKGSGSAVLTVSFEYEGHKVLSELNITVNKVEVTLAEKLSIDKSSPETNLMDISSYSWASNVEEIIHNGNVISDETNKLLILQSFVDEREIGDEVEIVFVTKDANYTMKLSFTNSFAEVAFTYVGGGVGGSYVPFTGDKDALGFDAETDVFEYTTATNSGWDNRLQTNFELKGYDWWLFDMVLTEAPTVDMTLWIGMFHVVLIKPTGDVTLLQPGSNFDGNPSQYNSVKVYDEDFKVVNNGLKPNVKYRIEIKLEYRDEDPRDSFSIAAPTTMYLANIVTMNQAYYEEHYARETPPSVPLPETLDVAMDLTSANNVGATFTYDETMAAYVWYSGVNPGPWASRIQTDDVNILNYDYFFIQIMLTEQLTTPITLWMDMDQVITIQTDNIVSNPTLSIYTEDGVQVNGQLSKNVIYQIVIKLVHAPSENRYAIGLSEETTVLVRNAFVATEAYYEDFLTTTSVPLPETSEIIFDLTEDNNVGATFAYDENIAVYVWNTGVDASAWASRIQSDDLIITNYDYIFFDMMLSEELTNPLTFWMDMTQVIHLQPDGSVNVNTISFYDEDGLAVEGALEAAKIYTVVIKLAHAEEENRYGLGFNQDTTVYIRNAFAATEEYHQSFIEANIPQSLEITFTANAPANTTIVYDELTELYTWNTGTGGAWDTMIASTNASLRNFEYLTFNMKLANDLSDFLNFWMGMGGVTTVDVNGVISTNRVKFYLEDGTLNDGPLLADINYLVVIKLDHSHADSRYALGFVQETVVELSNILAVSESYLNQIILA